VLRDAEGPLWWAGNHRLHHKHADGPEDLHSPRTGSSTRTWAGFRRALGRRRRSTGSATSRAIPSSCG
jgi:fatty-acid desaturase